MKITLKDLKDKGVCSGGKKWFIKSFGEDSEIDIEDLKNKLIEQKESDYLRWLYEKFKLSGEYIAYWYSGSIFVKCYYENGMRDGEYIKYDENGEIMEKTYWEKGVKIK